MLLLIIALSLAGYNLRGQGAKAVASAEVNATTTGSPSVAPPRNSAATEPVVQLIPTTSVDAIATEAPPQPVPIARASTHATDKPSMQPGLQSKKPSPAVSPSPPAADVSSAVLAPAKPKPVPAHSNVFDDR